MAELLLDRHLLAEKEKQDATIIDVAQAKIITAFRELGDDVDRKNSIFRFLIDAKLADFVMRNASLDEMDFSGTTLGNIDFSKARLNHANFSKAFLFETQFQQSKTAFAKFDDSEIIRANFSNANLNTASFLNSVIFQSSFQSAELKDGLIDWALMNDVVDFQGAILPDGSIYDRTKYEDGFDYNFAETDAPDT
jgi:uncharacterized protein YjbI with pentapeptide repeats